MTREEMRGLVNFVEYNCGSVTEETALALSRALSQLLDETEPRPIETAPKDGTEVDVWSCGKRYANACYRRPIKTWDLAWCVWAPGKFEDASDWRVIVPQPTHWRPIPAPPEAAPRYYNPLRRHAPAMSGKEGE